MTLNLPECSRQLVVVHVVFVLPQTPESGDFFGVDEFEFALDVICPRYDVSVLIRDEQLEKKLPQRNGSFHAWKENKTKLMLVSVEEVKHAYNSIVVYNRRTPTTQQHQQEES